VATLTEGAGEPPKGSVTVKTVASRAGVSAQTVSRVLRGTGYVSDTTRRKVLAAVDAVGYRPNAVGRSLRAARTPMVGLVVTDITNPFYARLHKAVEAVFCRSGLTLMLLNSDDDHDQERQQIELLASYRPSGLLLAPSVGSTAGGRELAGIGNCVQVSRTLPGLAAPAVVTNETESMAEATDALIAAGHREILAVLGPEEASTTKRRAGGYRLAMSRAGLTPLVHCTDQTADDARHVLTDALRAHPGATAAVAFNTPVTEGILTGLYDFGLRCPEDFSLVAFTDAPWMASFRPPISVIAQPVEAMGRLAAELMLDLIAGNDVPPVEHVVPGSLLGRGSVAAPR
jgi:DNA-binding LacI/PurR family transcriptional regulator